MDNAGRLVSRLILFWYQRHQPPILTNWRHRGLSLHQSLLHLAALFNFVFCDDDGLFHPNYIGAHQHRTARKLKKALFYGIRALPHLLKQAGYFTCVLDNKTECNFTTETNFSWVQTGNIATRVDQFLPSTLFTVHTAAGVTTRLSNH